MLLPMTFRKTAKESKIVTENDICTPDCCGRRNTNGFSRLRNTVGIKMLNTKNVDFLMMVSPKAMYLGLSSEIEVFFKSHSLFSK